MALLLAMSFTAGMSSGTGPNYAAQPRREVSQRLSSGVDCEQLRWFSVVDVDGSDSSDGWELRRDVWRAQQILDCDD